MFIKVNSSFSNSFINVLSQQSLGALASSLQGANGVQTVSTPVNHARSQAASGQDNNSSSDDQTQALINALVNSSNNQANPQGLTLANSFASALANPMVATPGAFALSAVAVLSPKAINKIIKAGSANKDYTTNVVAKALLKESPLSDKEIGELYTRAINFILHPEQIELPRTLKEMYTTSEQQVKAEHEYRKLVTRMSSMLVSGYLPMLTFDYDGFQGYKSPFFVSATGATMHNADRNNILTMPLALNRMRSIVKGYMHAHPNEKIDPDNLALYWILSMRSVAWDGESNLRVLTTPFWNNREFEDMMIDEAGVYGKGGIDSFYTEMGIGPEYEGIVNKVISQVGFGGPVQIKNGGEIKFYKGGVENKQFFRDIAGEIESANRRTSPEATSHINRLMVLSGPEFLHEYKRYLPGGDLGHINLGGYIPEIAMVTARAGIGIMEVKMVPQHVLDKEWEQLEVAPTYTNDRKIASYAKEAMVIQAKGGDWKSFLNKKFTFLKEATADDQAKITTHLWNVLQNANSAKDFAVQARRGSVFMVTSHAIDSLNSFASSSEKEFDFYKRQILLKIVDKYFPNWQDRLSVADNGVQAPYLEVSGKTDKADAFKDIPSYSIQVGGGDSIGTDLKMIYKGINDAYRKRDLIKARFDHTKAYFQSIGAWPDMAKEQEEQLIRSIVDNGIELGKVARGQIQLEYDKSLEHIIALGQADKQEGPFGLIKIADQKYQLVGDEFGSYKGQTLSTTELNKVLLEKAVPWYRERISFAPDTHQNVKQMADAFHSLLGLDPDKIDHNVLNELILGKNNNENRWGASFLMLNHEWQDQVDKLLGVRTPKNVKGLPATFIRNSPVIGGSISLLGAGLSVIGVVGEIYDNIKHENKYDSSFRDMIAKGFSVANLGLALTTVFIKSVVWPFQILGSLLGITSGFLPAGHVQQYAALGSMISWLFGSAREIGQNDSSFIDFFVNKNRKKMLDEFTYEDPRFMSGPKEGGKTYYDIKTILSLNGRVSRDRIKAMVKAGVPKWIAKTITDFRWNIDALRDVIKEPKLISFTEKLSATNGVEYKGAPHSMAHFLNTGGWVALSLLAVTGALQAISSLLKSKEAHKNDLNENSLIQNVQTSSPDINVPFTYVGSKAVSKQSSNGPTTLDKISTFVGGLSATIPAIVFFVQGRLRSQNANANRLLWARETGEQVRFRPGVIGNGLVAASLGQGLSAIATSMTGLGIFGTSSFIPHITQSLYNLGGGLALAFQGLGVKDGDSIGYVRDRLYKMGAGYMGDAFAHFDESMGWRKNTSVTQHANGTTQQLNRPKVAA
jgi:hypothetical protein